MHIRNAPSTTDLYTRVGLLGFVAGLRSQLPLFLLAGAAIAHEAGASALAGGAVGAVAAGAGSVAGNRFRVTLLRLARLPDNVGAIVEDATALGLGWFAALRRGSA